MDGKWSQNGGQTHSKIATFTKHCQAWSKCMSGVPKSPKSPSGEASKKRLKQNAPKSPTVTRMESQKGECFGQFCYFLLPKRHSGAKRCPEVPQTPQNLHLGTKNHQQFIQHAKKLINKSAYFSRRWRTENVQKIAGILSAPRVVRVTVSGGPTD